MVGGRAGKVVVLVVAVEFEQLPVEKAKSALHRQINYLTCPQRKHPAAKEVRRDALLTGRPTVPACCAGRG